MAVRKKEKALCEHIKLPYDIFSSHSCPSLATVIEGLMFVVLENIIMVFIEN